ncbi:hypothetical protein NADFUDRAFT_50115 [Nadsonia fulvescens var. elongata DSM 6958]|uniref:RNA polymerase II assembly factor Rtp1 C-terminal domain-containing protein n=1 Tax=Nadsonia fulvescens var. elongata DSM 6958 TaxID=857566 RepID=A0A1E3PMM7_9ASCO|nr:hypothetical protein NADFUDRAFT_50115 [Nadsonia fulvescens var. elongata DSM 6958]
MGESKSNQLQSVTPLDHIFDSVTRLLKATSDPNASAVENLFTAIQNEIKVVDLDTEDRVEACHREVVVKYLLTLLESIQTLSRQLQITDPNMITISLHDMKVFHALFNRIIIDGIYPCLTPGVGIPLRKRQKQSHRQRQLPISEPSLSLTEAHTLLQTIVDRLLLLLNQGGDIPDLILKGGYFNDIISATLELAYHPLTPSTPEERTSYQKAANQLIEKVDTYSLFMYLTSMIQPDSPSWFVTIITSWLARLTVDRPEDGVRSLIEFVSGSRHSDTISLDVLTRAIQVLKSVPRGFDPQRYAVVIGRQLIDILALAQPNSVLATATVHIVFTLFEQRRELIQKGVLYQIKELIDPSTTTTTSVPLNQTLVTESDLTIALSATTTLVKGGSNPQLIVALMNPIIKSLWLLLGYLCDSKKPLATTLSLFTTYIVIQGDKLETIADIVTANFFFAGQDTWSFKNGPSGGVEIRRTGFAELEVLGPKIFDKLDQRLDLFFQIVENFKTSGKTDLIGRLFLHTVKRWFSQREFASASVHHDVIAADPFAVLIDLRLLETFIEKYKATIVKSPSEIYRIVFTVLQDYVDTLSSGPSGTTKAYCNNIRSPSLDADSDDEDSDDEDEDTEQIETISMCLSLLTALISEAEQNINVDDQKLLSSAIPLLKYIADNATGSLSTRTTMCRQLLTQVLAGDTPGPGGEKSNPTDSNLNSRKILQEALAGLDDPLVPVRAHSLTTIRTLVQNRDPLLDMTTALNVFMAQLKDEDSFIYLNAIKGLEVLADIYGPSVLPLLLNQYISPGVPIDERLKVGEVLLRAEQRLGEALVGSAAELIAKYMISIIRRRPVKNGDEGDVDDRLRMSAMSILGMACELSPDGIGRWLDMAIECAVGILTMESAEDKAIMRRSAVVLLGSLFIGLEDTSQFPPAQVNAMIDKLKYIEATDNDVLVRHQASEVLSLITQVAHSKFVV